MTVTVYTLPVCQQCTMTKNWLTKHNIPFGTVDITTSPEAQALVKQLGYKSAPIIVAGADHWTGFRPDLLVTLTNAA